MQFSSNPFSGIPTVVKNLLIINGIMFLVKAIGLGSITAEDMDRWLGLHFMASPLFRPWQLVTHLFMHGNPGHLFMNMLMLFLAGSRLEYHWGSKKFLGYYMATGVGSALVFMIPTLIDYVQLMNSVSANDAVLVKEGLGRSKYGYLFQNGDMMELQRIYLTTLMGASGAIYGLLVAFGLLFPDLEIMLFPLFIPVKVKYLVFFMFAAAYYSSFVNNSGDFVAHLAHLGGMVIGYFLIRYWRRPNDHGFGGWGG